MTAKDFMERLGCTNITEGFNGRLRGYYKDCVLVESRQNNKNDKFDITALDTRRNALKELSYVACKKSSSKANSSTISDFQYRIDELIARKYDDREKIFLGTEVEVGKKYWNITEIENESSIILCEIKNVTILGVEAKPLKFHKDFSDFFNIAELKFPLIFNKDDWFTNEKDGPYSKDGVWNLHPLSEESFIELDLFERHYKSIEFLKS